LSSGSGSVQRVSSSSRPSVVGRCTSIICIAANFSSTLRGVSPGASACRRRARVTCRQIGQKGNEDVRLDAGLELVKDRPDREVALEVLERFLDRNQQQIMAPQLGRVFLDQVGAQQISTLARADLPQFVAIEAIAEGGGVCG